MPPTPESEVLGRQIHTTLALLNTLVEMTSSAVETVEYPPILCPLIPCHEPAHTERVETQDKDALAAAIMTYSRRLIAQAESISYAYGHLLASDPESELESRDEDRAVRFLYQELPQMIELCEFRRDWKGCMVDVREQAIVVRELLGVKNDEYRASMRRWRERGCSAEEGKDAEEVKLETVSEGERQDVGEGDGNVTGKSEQGHKGGDADEDMAEELWVAI